MAAARAAVGTTAARRALTAGGALALLVAWVASGWASNYSEQVVLGIASGSLFAILALAIVLVYRSTEVVNFAQGEMATFSTFVAWSLLQWVGERPIGVWLVLAMTVAIAFAMGAAMEMLIVRRVAHAPVLNTAVVALGFFTLFNSVSAWRYGNEPKPFPTPFSADTIELGAVTITYHTLGIIGVAVVVMGAMFALFQWTRLGLAMRATAEDPMAARLVGIRVGRMLTLGWALSAAVGAVAGVLIAHTLNLSPILMFNLLLFALAAAVVGGLTSPGGAVIGGLLIGIAQNVVGITDALGGSELRVFWAFALILLVLLVRPSGLFGRRRARRL
nr:ABC transporter permease [uncultured bacterium]